jgi:transposase InsO family protein
MYTTNPAMPRLRAKAVEMVRSGKSVTEVARYFGYTKGAVSKWCKKVPASGAFKIPTRSSRPWHQSHEIKQTTIDRIIELRIKLKGRCGEVIHEHLRLEGLKVGLRSVHRILDRHSLLKKQSPWKRLHFSSERPKALKPGDLVQVDTIHLWENRYQRIYVYTLIDVYSRWTYAWATERINTRMSIEFLRRAQAKAPFKFNCIQSDHGSEFSNHFTERIKILHRHSRVRKPNDNAHLERFNRTLQEECLRNYALDVKILKRAIPRYLNYYNGQRLHLGLNLKTPLAVI